MFSSVNVAPTLLDLLPAASVLTLSAIPPDPDKSGSFCASKLNLILNVSINPHPSPMNTSGLDLVWRIPTGVVFIPGENCHVDVDYCLQHRPCQNQAKCIDGKGVNEYKCTCTSGWKGQNCDEDIDECQLGYCQNNATCNNSLGSYACACSPGFTDYNCSTNINDCLPDPCENGGKCTDLINDFNCACQPGYEGNKHEYLREIMKRQRGKFPE